MNTEFLLDKFVLGLQEPLRTYVRLQNPPNWQIAKDWAISEDMKHRKVLAAKNHKFYPEKGNQYRNQNAFPLSLNEDFFLKIGQAQIFSKLDLMSGYYQIRMEPKDEEKTEFITPFGHYHRKVMPFGVTNGPATFQTFMNRIIGESPNVLVYLDDILIFSLTKEQHKKDLKRVLRILQAHQLIVRAEKCEFFKTNLTFLGHTINQKGIKPNLDKIEAIQNWPTPNTPKQAMQFMGLCNYYRKFVPQFSKIASPINSYMSGHVTWEKSQDKAFEVLKRVLTSPPVLILPNYSQQFRLTTDASYDAMGATLEQIDDKGKPLGTIAYFSKKFIGSQLNYFVTEKEFLAVIESLKHFRPILYDQNFILRTDHISLFSQSKVPQHRIARWLDYLSEYNFTIQHLTGTKNIADDALSRIGINAIQSFQITNTEFEKPTSKLYLSDPEFNTIYKCLTKNIKPPKEIHNHIRHFAIRDGLLYFSTLVGLDHTFDRLCIPASPRRTIMIELFHNATGSGHFGTYKTYYHLEEAAYWRNMFRDVHKFVQSCTTCQKSKALTQRTNSSYQKAIHTTPFMADLGPNPSVPPFQSTFQLNRVSTLAQDLADTLKAIKLRTEQYLADAQQEQERWANRTRENLVFEVGEWILLHRDAYSSPPITIQYKKVQPVFYGPFRLVKKINDLAFEVDIPQISKAHRTINIKWFRKFYERLEKHPKTPPRTRAEAIERAKLGEITEIAGHDEENKNYDVFWKDCHPGHASTIDEEVFNSFVPSRMKEYLLQKYEPFRCRQLQDKIGENIDSVPSSRDTPETIDSTVQSSDSLTTPSTSEDISSSNDAQRSLFQSKWKHKNRDDFTRTAENVRKRMRIDNITRI